MGRIYTRTGDAGTTALRGGRRVPKNHPRVEAYGALDELSSTLGAARAFLQDAELQAVVERIQRDLFVLGAEVAAPGQAGPQVEEAQVLALEREIDRLDAELPSLSTFVLPGGHPAGALLHLARAVCRRAERRMVALARSEVLNPEIVRYLNRLSDLLFVLARAVNRRAEVGEVLWPGEG
ncbi:MAG: cob(I)yrinic acid a,c-diamide adenosyltransferase [Armatimonadota bacterium]|nr:cob(I)yrinic acid a,c-diamide adenosyltransferase [Armatimonadota bacterium]MDR7426925.1 cob(I)yrinic acid a,c-diamide adenosyltransferase [Armatimonadota bacterium]MDR7463465.1 cob(I)yrinic acid a,c-diamide adenosyltransferase [Armatimonadota bacterium]MDR7470539.1 cob(I)yrinic acid a,c-diamide adenosyltransferase [Armatimonadota bacterium]MDR7474190.1 cob(I)yrinic acid a,c-diamide adenosyltransferase [Armatimonadota bacterium]